MTSLNTFLFVLEEGRVEILRLSGPSEVRLCENATLECEVQPLYSSVWWSLRGSNVSEDERYFMLCGLHSGSQVVTTIPYRLKLYSPFVEIKPDLTCLLLHYTNYLCIYVCAA